jgi:hypothetical protein
MLVLETLPMSALTSEYLPMVHRFCEVISTSSR